MYVSLSCCRHVVRLGVFRLENVGSKPSFFFAAVYLCEHIFKPMAPMYPVNHPFHVICDCLEPWRMTFEHSQEGRTFWGPSLWINILASICNSEAKEKLEPRPRVFRLACMWQQTGVARRQLTYAPKSPPKGSPLPLNAPLSPGKPLKG